MMRRVKGVVIAVVALAVLRARRARCKGRPAEEDHRRRAGEGKRASLIAADLPGWKATPHKKSDDASDPRCSYYNPDQSDLVEIGDYDSPDFDRADGSSIFVSTGVFRTVAMAKTAYSRVAQPTLARCLGEIFKKGAGGSTVTIFSAKPVQVATYGDRSSAFRVVASVKVNSTTHARVYLDILVLNKGAVDIAALALGIRNPLPGNLLQGIATKLASRA